MRLELGDCLDKLKELEDNSVDSIVTDPPYGLSFMGKKWDYDVPSTEMWIECLRVLKPGGHLLSFSGSRTYHRMAVRIEDAGFEIRDQIMWVYGSGFPKGKSQLKPAHEPIVLARKPLSEKSVAENVLKWGTGGLNIDESRIGYNDDKPHSVSTEREGGNSWNKDYVRTEDWEPNNTGRWPANIIFDEGDEPWRKFFYCPKASKKDRDDLNNHPTVKPTDLMLYLIKLVTPVNGVVLDPFLGSGSTGKAAIRGGFDFIGIEKEEEYIKIAEARINNA
jgi:site-specific DNA-methyltransferase (adenine-specific)